MEPFHPPFALFVIVLLAVWLFNSINVLREYERGVIFRLGRLFPEPKGPGLIFVWWPMIKS
jgi:regulator of protease activity HflC (stomatin/prohibitin superfamily)